MAINIYERKTTNNLAYLEDEEWGLASQLSILENWLIQNQDHIEPGDYVADIGFIASEEPQGGGGSFSCEAMRIAAAKGIQLFFSEYPG